MNLTNEQILNQLNTNGEFAINFIIDNNPNAVAENLTSYGVELPNNPSNQTIREILDELMITAPESDIQDILNVPYIDQPSDPDNYTGGLQAQLECPNPPCPRELTTGIIIAIISAVGAIGAGVASVVRSKKEKETAEIYLQQQEQLLAEQQRLEEANKILGINKSTFYVIIGLLALVMVIVVISKKK